MLLIDKPRMKQIGTERVSLLW